MFLSTLCQGSSLLTTVHAPRPFLEQHARPVAQLPSPVTPAHCLDRVVVLLNHLGYRSGAAAPGDGTRGAASPAWVVISVCISSTRSPCSFGTSNRHGTFTRTNCGLPYFNKAERVRRARCVCSRYCHQLCFTSSGNNTAMVRSGWSRCSFSTSLSSGTWSWRYCASKIRSLGGLRPLARVGTSTSRTHSLRSFCSFSPAVASFRRGEVNGVHVGGNHQCKA
jgi:hypothetical protein